MTLYMLDTNIVSDMMRNPPGGVAEHVGSAAGGACTCANFAPLDVQADAEYGALRAELESAGRPIGPNDLLIAAHARSIGAIMVTGNPSGFRRVGGLSVEDWTA